MVIKEEEIQEIVTDKNITTILKLRDIKGVGTSTLSKLNKIGIFTIRGLAISPINKLIKANIGPNVSKKIIREAQKFESVGFVSAEAISIQRKGLRRLTTGIKDLDYILGGGLERQSIMEIWGPSGIGKTQFMHQLCVNVQLPFNKGGLESGAIYIDTEGTFRPERIEDIANKKGLDKKQCLKNIEFGRAYNIDIQHQLIRDASELISNKNIKLIVIDSIINHFRKENSRISIIKRQQAINSQLEDLITLSETYGVAVVYTNQVASKINGRMEGQIVAPGGNILKHNSITRILFAKNIRGQRIAKLIKSPCRSNAKIEFELVKGGLRNTSENDETETFLYEE